jgi:peptidyl-prolyl cis-trans isomerase C
MQGSQYHVRHILVEKEGDARDLPARLAAGSDFAELAQACSIDPHSGARWGELDGCVPQPMLPAFREAARALQPGATPDQPLQSPFGWHIVHLEGTRAARVPERTAVRTELVEIVENRAVQQSREDLRTQTRIEIPVRETG